MPDTGRPFSYITFIPFKNAAWEVQKSQETFLKDT